MSLRRALAAGLLLAAPAAAAREVARIGDLAVDVRGSVREIVLLGHGTDADDFTRAAERAALRGGPLGPIPCVSAAVFADCPAFDEVGHSGVATTTTRLRVQVDASLGRALSATVAYDHQLRFGTLDTLEEQVGNRLAGDEWLDLYDEIGLGSPEHAEWIHKLYRAYLRGEWGRFEAEIGRQRIAWGVGRLWNPIDRLNPIPPLAIEPDESPGVDAIDLRWRFADFGLLEGVYAPGPRPELGAWALRLHGTRWGTDASLLGGVFQQAPTVGLDLARNLGDAAVRLEAVYTDPERRVWPVEAPRPRAPDPYWQIVASADYNFDLGSGIYVLVEHFYNGNALGFGRGRAGPLLPLFEATNRAPTAVPLPPGSAPFVRPADADVFAASPVASGARNQTGLQASYDLTLALRAEMLAIVDWSGGSAAFFPTLRYTGFSSAEITAGVQLFTGPARSEYGSREPFFYLLVDWFF